MAQQRMAGERLKFEAEQFWINLYLTIVQNEQPQCLMLKQRGHLQMQSGLSIINLHPF
jgi:hypothetical protein